MAESGEIGHIHMPCPMCSRRLRVSAGGEFTTDADGTAYLSVFVRSITGCPHVDGGPGGPGETARVFNDIAWDCAKGLTEGLAA